MPAKPHQNKPRKTKLHPRNRHQGRYHLRSLTSAWPALKPHIIKAADGTDTLDFSDPKAVTALNQALLSHWYGIREWSIPANYLCPPVPGRADYIHALADLLGESHDGNIPTGGQLTGLDLGTGANLIYPLIGCMEYQWHFVGVDIDPDALTNATRIIEANPPLANKISLRLQTNPAHIFAGVIHEKESFDFTLCNPPFHASATQAAESSQRKWRNLGKPATDRSRPTLNFGGQASELICEGGESGFLSRMIDESKTSAQQVFWFTTLVSKAVNLPALQQQLKAHGARDIRIVPMAQGQKQSRMLAWTFLDKNQRRAWRKARWVAKRPT